MNLSTQTIHTRLKLLIEQKTTSKERFKRLEQLTGISSKTWDTYFRSGVRPSAELIEGASKAWPENAFWLASGIEDRLYGHSSPENLNNKNTTFFQNLTSYQAWINSIEIEKLKTDFMLTRLKSSKQSDLEADKNDRLLRFQVENYYLEKDLEGKKAWLELIEFQFRKLVKFENKHFPVLAEAKVLFEKHKNIALEINEMKGTVYGNG